jgi:predicted component of viral defense system (DUF524 family)|tara:strand:- start:10 stop:270 length:261 start_codon:yes stop_codon:yes gene_type:complete
MMSDTLFKRIRHLLKDHIALLNKHSLGDTHVEQAENIVDELDIFLRTDSVAEVEQTISNAEKQQMVEDIADEILNGKHCVGGSCDD